MTTTYPVRSRLFRALCTQPVKSPGDYRAPTYWDDHLAADERWFDRLPDDLDLDDKHVLDYGCGGGHTALGLLERGAEHVVGVDIEPVDLARRTFERDYAELSDQVDFKQIESAGDIGDEQFDVVVSKNAFEHVADPAGYARDMSRLAKPGGRVVIGFGGLWKSPYGGHIDFMTKVPYAHLLFPEEVILRERRRYRPDEDPSRFEEIKGGLNRMTLERFERIMDATDLVPEYVEINRNDRPAAKALNMLSKVPGLREYFTFSIHSVWRRAGARA
jgi:SAM-dependent methyltransferase